MLAYSSVASRFNFFFPASCDNVIRFKAIIVTLSQRSRNTSNRVYDAVVIGAGHNGLTAAAYLARAGLSVLVLERRDIVGGCCVTEEIAPGCRVSTTSYIASMLRPEVVSELRLADHGLRMIPCDPAIQVPFPDGHVVPWWADRERAREEFSKISSKDAARFVQVDDQLKKLARYLQPFFLEPPPEIDTSSLKGWSDLFRAGKRFRGISNCEVAQLVSFLTGSLGEFLDQNYESEKMKTMFLANNVYGKHGGPYQPGSAIGLLFHLLSGGEHELQGFYGHVMGGMGSITQALAAAGKKLGVEIRTGATVAHVDVRSGRARHVVLDDGTEFRARMVMSNADPKRTFLGLLDAKELPEDFLFAVRGIKMDGPCAKVNMVLAEEPRFTGTSPTATPLERTFYTLVPSLEFAERCYDIAKFGEIPEELWVDCVVSSNADVSLAPPGKHILTCFVQYVPYRLRDGNWDEKRELLGDRVVRKIAEYAPNVPRSVVARQVLTPLDLERTYGLTEGNIFHGDLRLEQLFFMRPVPGWSQYRTPIDGLYLCGAGAHPGGGVTGAPGRNAAHQALRDWKKGRHREAA
jgi:phytoene dehydrogenase-like protein